MPHVPVSVSETYAVQMDGVSASDDATRHAQFHNRVGREGDDATCGHEIVRVLSAAKDLEQNRGCGWDKRRAVDLEVTANL